jgi:hypothetical protein
MKIKTKRTLYTLLVTALIVVLELLLIMAMSPLPVVPFLETLLGSPLGGNILLIVLIIATVFTGALFDFLLNEGTARSLSTYHLHLVSLDFVSGMKRGKS